MHTRLSERAWTLPSFVLLALGAVAMRWGWINGDLTQLVATILPDDAFYYFEIAQHIWAGDGITFDGVTPATGMHPLWLLAVLPFFKGSTAGAIAPLHGVLLLSALLAAVAALQLSRLVWRVTDNLAAGVLLGFAFLANHWVVSETLNGLETTLALALMACVLVQMHSWMTAPSMGRALGLGALVALCILARSDTAVILLPPCALLLLYRRPWHPEVLVVAALPALAILALSLFNYKLTGSFAQSSATAVPWVGRENWRLFNPDAGALAFQKVSLGTAVFGVIKVIKAMGWVTAGVALFGGLLSLPALRTPAHTDDTMLRDAARIAVAMVVGLLLLHFVHGYFRWIIRTYYFAGWSLVVFLVPALALRCWCPAALASLGTREATPMARSVGAGLLCFLVFQLSMGAMPHVAYPWQVEMLRAAEEVRNRFAPEEPVGAFNAAIVAYVNDRPIVNLDGVVNEDATRAIRAGNLAAYMRSRHLRYVVDSPAMWTRGSYFATLAPWFHPGHKPLAFDSIATVDTPNTGFPTPADHIEIIELRKTAEDMTAAGQADAAN